MRLKIASKINNAEEWRKVPSYEDYEVSSLGKVRRIKAGKGTKAGLILKPSKQHGYVLLSAQHSSGYGSRMWKVGLAELVLLVFRGLPEKAGSRVEYADGDESNCQLANLSWRRKLTPYMQKKAEQEAKAAAKEPQKAQKRFLPLMPSADLEDLEDVSGLSEVESEAGQAVQGSQASRGRPKEPREQKVNKWLDLIAVLPRHSHKPINAKTIQEAFLSEYDRKVSTGTIYKWLKELMELDKVSTEVIDPDGDSSNESAVGYKLRPYSMGVLSDFSEYLEDEDEE